MTTDSPPAAPIAAAPSALASIAPLAAFDDAAFALLRTSLERSGYSQEVLAEAERIAPMQLDAVRLPLVHWHLRHRGGPARALARLFSYADTLSVAEAREALGSDALPLLVESGLLATSPEVDGHPAGLRARFRLTPLEGLFVLSDAPDAGGDAVMGPGITTLDLVRLLPPPSSSSSSSPCSVLDLGCGAGSLALLAARRGAKRAVGVDLNARAIAMARFNARLNAVSAEFAAGDLLAPIGTERFDRVFSQPPYVVQPADVDATTYLHGGPSGDELALRFAAAIPAALTDGGIAFVAFDSAARAGRPLHARLRALLGAAPVDLIVFAAHGPSADLQAVAYSSLQDSSLGATYRASVHRYRAHLDAMGATDFKRAMVALVRSGVDGGRFTIELPVPGLSGIDAASFAEFLEGIELASAPEPRLCEAQVKLSPHARLVDERRATSEAVRHSIRFDPSAIGSDREISEAGLALLDAIEGASNVGGAVVAFAAACGEPSTAAVRPTVVNFVREGLARGLLVAAPPPSRGGEHVSPA